MTGTRSSKIAALAAALVACGGGGGGGGTGGEVNVRGTLSQSEAFAVPGQVTFAIQWTGAAYSGYAVNADPNAPDPEFVTSCADLVPISMGACDGTAATGKQSCHTVDVLATALLRPVRYDAAFPISFSVPVDGAPPAESLYDLSRQGGSGVFAMGTVLAFEDTDGDGVLRLGTPGVPGEPGLANSAYQDYVPADGSPRRSYFLTYLRGTIDPGPIFPGYAEVLLGLPQGYAIWQKDERVDAYGRRLSVHRSAQPIDTPVALVSRPGIADSAIWCSAFEGTMTYLPALPAGEVPDQCWSGGLGAGWSRATTVAPCTFDEDRYWADFTCASTTPPWSASCP